MLHSSTLQKPRKNYHVQPGEIFVTGEDMNISTVLGSCVAVCLWDNRRKIGGMNHVMLPRFSAYQDPSTKYANVATFVLWDMMKERGCLRGDITASIYGGANSMMSSSKNLAMQVGKNNIEVTKNILGKLKFQISHKDTGGAIGRKIRFDCVDGKIKAEFLRRFDFVHELDSCPQ